MFGVALTVAACLQAGTRADVAWIAASEGLPVADWADAIVLTPGGGRIGSPCTGWPATLKYSITCGQAEMVGLRSAR